MNLFEMQFCVMLLVAAVLGAEEKKNEKRGVLGLGYGLGAPAAGLYGGHGLGLYSHGVGGLGWGHGLAAAPVLGHGFASAPLLGPGLYGAHGYSAPLLGHPASYGAPLLSHAPLLGLGHGIGYGGWR